MRLWLGLIIKEMIMSIKFSVLSTEPKKLKIFLSDLYGQEEIFTVSIEDFPVLMEAIKAASTIGGVRRYMADAV